MVTFDEEWAQLKADAATRMNLAAAGDGGGPGDGDLKTSKAAWSKAATSIAELRGDVKRRRPGLTTDRPDSERATTRSRDS